MSSEVHVLPSNPLLRPPPLLLELCWVGACRLSPYENDFGDVSGDFQHCLGNTVDSCGTFMQPSTPCNFVMSTLRTWPALL